MKFARPVTEIQLGLALHAVDDRVKYLRGCVPSMTVTRAYAQRALGTIGRWIYEDRARASFDAIVRREATR